MTELVSPKQVAHAIGVSESSLKRWCDQGLIQTVRTAGGHRRLSVSAVLAYLKQSGHPLVAPEMLGLPPLTPGAGKRSLDKAFLALREALVQGNDELARRVILDAFLAGHPVHAIADDAIAPAFHEIGRLWGCGEVAVYQERQACEIVARVLFDLRNLIDLSVTQAPLAIGGTLEGDYYCLPNSLAELTLRAAGWNAHSLGTHLPVATFEQAIHDQNPRLVWLSVSHFQCPDQFVTDVTRIVKAAAQIHAPCVIGGRVICGAIRELLPSRYFCDSMQALNALAHALRETGCNSRISSP